MRLPIICFTLFSSALSAETVDVRHWGLVDLAAYDCTETASSFVHQLCYSSEDEHLVVRLRDNYYAYCRVDQSTVSDWLMAPSKGRFYNQRIRSNAVGGLFSCG